jgi:hypothetical protein
VNSSGDWGCEKASPQVCDFDDVDCNSDGQHPGARHHGVLTSINQNYDGGTHDAGYLQ